MSRVQVRDTAVGYMLAHNPQPTMPTDAENRALCKKARNARSRRARTEARNQIMLRNSSLVTYIARRIPRHSGMSHCDIIQEGTLGLYHAVYKFDLSRDIRFVSYAAVCIYRTIQRATIKRGHLIRIPEYLLRDDYVPEYIGDRPVVPTIVPLDRRGSCKEGCLLHVIAEPAPDRPPIDVLAIREEAYSFLRLLCPQERTVVESYYGIGSESGPKTEREIGEAMGVSRARVSSLRRRAMAKLERAALARSIA